MKNFIKKVDKYYENLALNIIKGGKVLSDKTWRRRTLKREVNDILNLMNKTDKTSDEYAELVKQLVKIEELRHYKQVQTAGKRNQVVDVALGAAQLGVNIWQTKAVLEYEEDNVISSKAFMGITKWK